MPVSLIVDTDIDTDCDDAGALAVLHALAKLGEAQILGIICSIPFPPAAACVRAINRYYQRPEIPVGLLQSENLNTSPRFESYRRHLRQAPEQGWQRYNEQIAAEFPEPQPAPTPDAVELYRTMLAHQPDASVVIVAIGFLTALQKLLASPPDSISPLHGADLVARKVSRLVTMAIGSFPAGEDVFNWKMDREAAGVVLNQWSTELVVSEWGTQILTGASLHERTPADNPVRRAYEIYLGGAGRSRSSWDQVAILYAVRGAGHFFSEITDHRLRFDTSTGQHEWIRAEPDQPRHIYLSQMAQDADLARVIEDLMTQPVRA